jgi:hypothetical protein
MSTNGYETARASLTSKSFCAVSTNGDQPQPEFSGFGVRVPGGAQKPRSQRGLGFFMPAAHLLFDAFGGLSLAAAGCADVFWL